MSRKSGPIRNRLRAPDQRPSASLEQLADAKGNRAERRAWAKLTKSKTPPPVSFSDSTKEAGADV